MDLMMTGWQAENERRAWRVCWGAVHNEELKQHRFVQPALKDVEITGSYPSHPYHPGRPRGLFSLATRAIRLQNSAAPQKAPLSDPCSRYPPPPHPNPAHTHTPRLPAFTAPGASVPPPTASQMMVDNSTAWVLSYGFLLPPPPPPPFF